MDENSLNVRLKAADLSLNKEVDLESFLTDLTFSQPFTGSLPSKER